MSNTILIDLTDLDSRINTLESLMEEWKGNSGNPPEILGGGKTSQEIQELIDIYDDIYFNLIELMGDTIRFLRAVRTGYFDNDVAAGNLIKSVK